MWNSRTQTLQNTEVSRAYDQDKWQFPAEGALNVKTVKVIDFASSTELKKIHCFYHVHISVIKICLDCEVTGRNLQSKTVINSQVK